MKALCANARIVLYRLQSARGNALYVIPSLTSPDDRLALADLQAAGLVQIREVGSGVIVRAQATLTDAGRGASVESPWEMTSVARQP